MLLLPLAALLSPLANAACVLSRLSLSLFTDVGGYFDVVKMVEADESRAQTEAAHKEGKREGGGSQVNIWASQMKKHVLPRGIGFEGTFGKYIGKETRIEVMQL